MNILLINHYAGSVRHGMEYRPYYMAREWVKHGHQVRIVAGSYSHVRARQPSPEQGEIEHIDGIEYQWLSTPSYGGNSSARAVNIFAFAARLLAESSRLSREFKPDIVIASSTHPFDIYGAQRIARASKARLIFEIHDLWPLSPMELGGMSPYHPFILAVGAAEKRALAGADTVISILPVTKNYLVGRGMAPNKFVHVPNGIDVAEWDGAVHPLPAPQAAALAELRAQGKLLVGYAGAHGIANELTNMLGAAQLSNDGRVHFVLVGHGPEKESLIANAARAKLANVSFLDPVPKASVPSLLSEFDILYFGLQKQPLFRFGVSPNKMMDYMMAAKPIIQAVAAGNDPVKDAGCGLTIAPEDPQALVDAIETVKQLDPAAATEMGQRGRAYALAHHDYRVLAENFLAAAAGRPTVEPR